jgi:hypothetical protein
MGGVPGMEAGGAGAAPGMGAADMGMATGAGALPRVMKRGKAGKEEENQVPPSKEIKFTKLEQKMYRLLTGINIPQRLFAQYQVKVAGEQRPFMIDFAYPQIGVGVECLHPDSLVPTKVGTKMAKDINEGECLIGKNGDEVKVLHKFINQSKGDLLKIKPFGMSEISVTKNHPFLSCKKKKVKEKRNGEIRNRWYDIQDLESINFINASDLDKSLYLMVPKYRKIKENIRKTICLKKYIAQKSHNSVALPNNIEITQDLCWLMGIYAAEGSARYTKKGGCV